MNRRTFLKTSAVGASAAISVPGLIAAARAQQKEFNPRPANWRTFEMTTRVEVLQPVGVTRVWVPIPVVASDYQRPGDTTWSGSSTVIQTMTDPKYGAAMVYAEFAEGSPIVEVTSRFQTRDRAVDWSRKAPAQEDAA